MQAICSSNEVRAIRKDSGETTCAKRCAEATKHRHAGNYTIDPHAAIDSEYRGGNQHSGENRPHRSCDLAAGDRRGFAGRFPVANALYNSRGDQLCRNTAEDECIQAIFDGAIGKRSEPNRRGGNKRNRNDECCQPGVAKLDVND
jgi:hypothetical protein